MPKKKSSNEMKEPIPISMNVYDSLSPIFQASRASGICPLKVERKNNGFSFVWSRKFLVYSYVSVIVLVCCSIYGMVQNSKIREVYNIRLRTIKGLVCTLSENVCLLMSCLLGTFLTPLYKRFFWKYLECLYNVDTLLGHRNLNQRKKCLRVMLIILSLTVMVVSLDIVLWSNIATKRTSLIIFLLNSLPFYVTYLCQMIVELHFWVLVHLVKVRLICLNEDLSLLLQEVEICSRFFKNNEYMDKKLVKVIKHDESLRCKQGIDRRGVSGEKISKKVNNAINIHNLLVEASKAANKYFGINILMILFGCLVHLLITPYILYIQIKETKHHVFVSSQLMWLICHICRLIFIIEPCQACKLQVQITSFAACKLLRFEICEEAKHQLRTFLIQLDRCRIQFAACGLVVINRALLTAVTGTVTTYLVILFQFK